jgi:acetamidase/formamidase
MRRFWAIVLGCLVAVSLGCATAERLPAPTVDVTGTWSGTWQFEPASVGGGTISMTLVQKGAEVSGPIQVDGPTLRRPAKLQGVVIGDVLQVTGEVDGRITVTGDEMSGELNGFVPVKLTARRQR